MYLKAYSGIFVSHPEKVRYWGLRDKEGRPPPFKGFLLVEKIIGKRTTKVCIIRKWYSFFFICPQMVWFLGLNVNSEIQFQYRSKNQPQYQRT